MKNSVSLWKNSHLPDLYKENRLQLFSAFDDLFDQMWSEAFPSVHLDFGKAAYPKVNVEDTPTNIIIEAEIPGLTKEDVKLTIDQETLTISGAKNEKNEDKNKTYLRRELKRSSFSRSFWLDSKQFDLEKADAKFENGTLLITVQKKQPEKVVEPKQIKIK